MIKHRVTTAPIPVTIICHMGRGFSTGAATTSSFMESSSDSSIEKWMNDF